MCACSGNNENDCVQRPRTAKSDILIGKKEKGKDFFFFLLYSVSKVLDAQAQ